MPFRNAAPWLEDTVRSIQVQECKDWELLAVNDHSTDQSLQILRELAKTDARIQVLNNLDQGIIPALQLAFSHAKGSVITRMDADDCMPANRLQVMLDALLERGPKTVLTGKVEYFPSPVSEGYQKYAAWLNARIDLHDHYVHIFRECVVASPNWMFFRSDAEEAAIFQQLKYPEDYDMVFHWYTAGFTIHGVDQTTLLWREHPARTSRNSSVYAQASFFKLKLDWFCRIHAAALESLALFGAGDKGKIVAAYLMERGIPFTWYDLNHSKYGAGVHGNPIHNPNDAKESNALICVYLDDSASLENFLAKKGFELGRNGWYL